MIRGRWLVVVLAAGAWLFALAVWIGSDPGIAESAFEPFSSYNSSPGGLSQAWAYLALRHPDVRRLFREIALERPPRDAVVFRVGSVLATSRPAIIEKTSKKQKSKKAAAKQKKAERDELRARELENLLSDDDEEWVRSGGRFIIAPSADTAGIHLIAGSCSAYHPVFPAEPPLPGVEVANCHSLSGPGLQHFHSLVNNADGPVVARWSLGAGEVILLSLPEAFSNEYIGKGGNLAMLERLTGNARTIFFDERLHGIAAEGSITDLLVGTWRLGPALIVLAAAAIAAFWRRAAVAGAPDRADRDVRSDAVDLVQSVGQLYDRAVDRETSLRLYYQALVRASHARTGLSGDALDRFVRERTKGFDPKPSFHDITKEEFQRALRILNRAHEMVGHANTR